MQGSLTQVEKEGLKELLSSAPKQQARGKVLLVNEQSVFLSAVNCTSCKNKGKILVKWSELLL